MASYATSTARVIAGLTNDGALTAHALCLALLDNPESDVLAHPAGAPYVWLLSEEKDREGVRVALETRLIMAGYRACGTCGAYGDLHAGAVPCV